MCLKTTESFLSAREFQVGIGPWIWLEPANQMIRGGRLLILCFRKLVYWWKRQSVDPEWLFSQVHLPIIMRDMLKFNIGPAAQHTHSWQSQFSGKHMGCDVTASLVDCVVGNNWCGVYVVCLWALTSSTKTPTAVTEIQPANQSFFLRKI